LEDVTAVCNAVRSPAAVPVEVRPVAVIAEFRVEVNVEFAVNADVKVDAAALAATAAED
jgi:hypothetical protein